MFSLHVWSEALNFELGLRQLLHTSPTTGSFCKSNFVARSLCQAWAEAGKHCSHRDNDALVPCRDTSLYQRCPVVACQPLQMHSAVNAACFTLTSALTRSSSWSCVSYRVQHGKANAWNDCLSVLRAQSILVVLHLTRHIFQKMRHFLCIRESRKCRVRSFPLASLEGSIKSGEQPCQLLASLFLFLGGSVSLAELPCIV